MSSVCCSTCKRKIETAIINCVECEERFCTNCYRKCPTVRNHVPAHKYTVDQNDKSFLRKGYTYEQEKEILKAVENCPWSISSEYTDFYLRGPISDLTVPENKSVIVDHTEDVEDTTLKRPLKVAFEDQVKLGLYAKRDDFVPEVHDDAEDALVNLPESLPQEMRDIAGKIFHTKFAERHRIRRVIRKYKLVDRYLKYKTSKNSFEKIFQFRGAEQLTTRKKLLQTLFGKAKAQDRYNRRSNRLKNFARKGCVRYSDIEKENQRGA
ncbi:Oidioi.mRNA.OKI2018_I69.chr2.g5503.t1.cds [Oikopleura dioica]|uniref:Oidioi.mRNA.OKI2018_I69.chr2.g5503.t1.cds n=1 Tax=Oikopleura dioica TaxID=34765 RepID=A0ABN7T9P1_OIKDI|nr:Oidioi.mRNA.OKI2018_I69.chr2.g5503.t1.cds [Oikopleura dioica]